MRLRSFGWLLGIGVAAGLCGWTLGALDRVADEGAPGDPRSVSSVGRAAASRGSRRDGAADPSHGPPDRFREAVQAGLRGPGGAAEPYDLWRSPPAGEERHPAKVAFLASLERLERIASGTEKLSYEAWEEIQRATTAAYSVWSSGLDARDSSQLEELEAGYRALRDRMAAARRKVKRSSEDPRRPVP